MYMTASYQSGSCSRRRMSAWRLLTLPAVFRHCLRQRFR